MYYIITVVTVSYKLGEHACISSHSVQNLANNIIPLQQDITIDYEAVTTIHRIVL